MLNRAARWGLAIFIGTFGALPVAAQSVRLIGDYRDWSAYSATEGTGAICFAQVDVTDTAACLAVLPVHEKRQILW